MTGHDQVWFTMGPPGREGQATMKSHQNHHTVSGWWLTYPSEKHESQIGSSSQLLGKIKNVPNHQPVYYCGSQFPPKNGSPNWLSRSKGAPTCHAPKISLPGKSLSKFWGFVLFDVVNPIINDQKNVVKTILNQPPNHHFYRWYVYHSQMGSLLLF